MVAATLVGCIFLAVFILDSAQDLFGLNQPDQIIEVIIPEGASNGQVADILYEKGIITKNLTFRIYSSLTVKEGEYKPGKYPLNTNMGYDELNRDLKSGNIQRQEVRITFIEGWTLQDIAKMLEEENVCDAQEFIDYLQTAELDYEFMDRIPENPLRFRRMEGYIFPDTYDFWVGEGAQRAAKRFLDNFRNRITDEMENKMRNLGLSLDETIVLASIIQKEAGTLEEMKNVSAVFHNRLQDSATFPKLQSDVTIHYVEKLIKPYIEVRNQEMYDAYNTYVCDGLPAGPICNPGLAAIEAALNPADTDYLFFVTDVNNNYYYAVTAEEHYKNVSFAFAQEPEEGNTGEVHGTGVQGD